jgi:hypothetical protein
MAAGKPRKGTGLSQFRENVSELVQASLRAINNRRVFVDEPGADALAAFIGEVRR